MDHAQSVSCFVMFAAGSRYERREESGIAHFAEHMFFKGTERRPTARDIATEIDTIGGEFNAFTGKELTGYYVKCAAETRDVALDVLVDMLRNSRFDARRDRPREGRDRRGDEHVRRHAAELRRQRLGASSLRRPAARLGRDRQRRRPFARRRATRSSATSARWYLPERTVIGLGGQIGDDALARLEELVGDIEPGATGTADSRRPTGQREPGPDPHEAVRPGARRDRRAELSRTVTRTGTSCSSSRRSSAAACRRACSRRCGSGVGSRTTSSPATRATPTPARSARRRAST